MSLVKKDIVKNISSKAHISLKVSNLFLEHFLKIIKINKNHEIKVSNFGKFSKVKTLPRVGRNPKTNENFKIKAFNKLSFRASNKVKSILN